MDAKAKDTLESPVARANPFAAANPFMSDASANPFAGSPFADSPVIVQATDAPAPPGSYAYQLVKSGPEVSAEEMEVLHRSTVEVMVVWDSNVLHVEHVGATKSFTVGEAAVGASCNFNVPAEVLGTTSAALVDAFGTVLILPAATGTLEVPGQGKVALTDWIASGRARPSTSVSGAHEVQLPAGAKLRQELPGGLAFVMTAGNAGKAPPTGPFASFDPAAYVYTGLSMLLHVGILASFCFFMPSLGADDNEALDREAILRMQHLLSAEAERAKEQTDAPVTPDDADNKEGGHGDRAKGEEGSMGNPNTNKTGQRYGVQGPRENQDPHLARQAALKEAAEFGMIGLLNAAGGADPNAPTAPWGRDDSLGNDPMSARGNMWGDSIGESFGAGGLGLSGVGEGGGGPGQGIGLGGLNIGHGGGPGDGQGFGIGHGPLHGGHVVKSPGGLRQGNPTINGRLPPEVIQRIVRQNFGRFRLCYESGLRANPSLSGRVSVKFVIDRSGAVSMSQDGGSELPDQGVVQCVVRSFSNLSFPQPEGGIVTVVYPMTLDPSQ